MEGSENMKCDIYLENDIYYIVADIPGYRQIIQEYLKDIEQIDSTMIKSNY